VPFESVCVILANTMTVNSEPIMQLKESF